MSRPLSIVVSALSATLVLACMADEEIEDAEDAGFNRARRTEGSRRARPRRSACSRS